MRLLVVFIVSALALAKVGVSEEALQVEAPDAVERADLNVSEALQSDAPDVVEGAEFNASEGFELDTLGDLEGVEANITEGAEWVSDESDSPQSRVRRSAQQQPWVSGGGGGYPVPEVGGGGDETFRMSGSGQQGRSFSPISMPQPHDSSFVSSSAGGLPPELRVVDGGEDGSGFDFIDQEREGGGSVEQPAMRQSMETRMMDGQEELVIVYPPIIWHPPPLLPNAAKTQLSLFSQDSGITATRGLSYGVCGPPVAPHPNSNGFIGGSPLSQVGLSQYPIGTAVTYECDFGYGLRGLTDRIGRQSYQYQAVCLPGCCGGGTWVINPPFRSCVPLSGPSQAVYFRVGMSIAFDSDFFDRFELALQAIDRQHRRYKVTGALIYGSFVHRAKFQAMGMLRTFQSDWSICVTVYSPDLTTTGVHHSTLTRPPVVVVDDLRENWFLLEKLMDGGVTSKNWNTAVLLRG